jgi:hypothetical protein
MRLSTFQRGEGKLQGGAGQKYLSGMSNFDQRCEPYGADPRTTLVYKRCACRPGSWWEADVRVKERDICANGLHQAKSCLINVSENSFEELTFKCLLLENGAPIACPEGAE